MHKITVVVKSYQPWAALSSLDHRLLPVYTKPQVSSVALGTEQGVVIQTSQRPPKSNSSVLFMSLHCTKSRSRVPIDKVRASKLLGLAHTDSSLQRQ